VNVTDSNGRPVSTLTKEDFQVFEDSVPQNIQSFSPVDVPYSVLLLFDCSGSTKPQQPLLLAAMRRFMNRLRPQDAIAIAQFGTGTDLRLDWKPRNTQLGEVELGNYEGCNNTDFYGALDWAARKMNGVTGRKGVIVYTDGLGPMPMHTMSVGGRGISRPVDTISDPTFQRVLQAVRASRASFYFVAIDTDLNPRAGTPVNMIYTLQQVRARMEQVADASGGQVAFPKTDQDVIPMYEQIARGLETSYSLSYVSSNTNKDGRSRTIEVRLSDTTLRVRQSRTNYVTP
jgi:Ca-activated chloride channel family protein